MDSKRDIRPKLASRLLKDSLVLHCLFRVSLATQHIIGTIIFLKQRKNEKIRITFFESTRSASIARRLCVHVHHVCHFVGDTLVYRLSALRSFTGHPSWIRLVTRARASTTNDVDWTLNKKRTMKIIRKKSFNCQWKMSPIVRSIHFVRSVDVD